jgi:NAD(P) transhydrogenase subunit alpha
MKIGIPYETTTGETRVAATPETVKKMVAQGHSVLVEKAAGLQSAYTDDAYKAAGAELVDVHTAFSAQMVFKIRPPNTQELQKMAKGTVLLGMLEPYNLNGLQAIADAGLTAFALEAAPRTTRAQSLDVLSSQANIAGYKAVILAVHHYQRLFPMLMTAAGTIKAARVVILGVGVAGLQAIATAKRLGAVVEASDVRPSVKEQVESLGAKFIDVPYENEEERQAAEGVGGYARAMPASWLSRQQLAVAKRIALADIVISTALIPGKAAPTLITEEMVQSMKAGSVIVDIAAGRAKDGIAGNCTLTKAGQITDTHGVTLVGETNLPALVATDASALYARNLLDFLKLVVHQSGEHKGEFYIPTDDDIVSACLVSQDGQLTPSFQQQ